MVNLLVFLDFDGVTHPRVGTPAFLPECMSALKTALEGFDVEIVVSSSWRKTNHFLELVEFLMPLKKPVVGFTPVIDDDFSKPVRNHEIDRYLHDHDRVSSPWIAIDDEPKFFAKGDSHVFFTDSYKGFTADDIIWLQDFIRQSLSANL